MLIVKIMADDGLPDDDARSAHTLFADVRSVSFNRRDDGSCFARMYVLDEVKTATVPGFTEHEVLADVPGNAYVLNDRGRTVDSFNGGAPLAFTDQGEPVMTGPDGTLYVPTDQPGHYAGLVPADPVVPKPIRR